jgi:hypothetical protein
MYLSHYTPPIPWVVNGVLGFFRARILVLPPEQIFVTKLDFAPIAQDVYPILVTIKVSLDAKPAMYPPRPLHNRFGAFA